METSRSTLFRPYARWVITHRVVVVGVILAITGFLTSRLGTLQIDSNPDLWAPQQHPYVETTNLLDEVFGGRNFTVIGVVPRSGDIYQPAVLEKIERLQDQIELLPHAVRHNVLSLAARKIKRVSGAPDGMEVRPMMDTVPRTPEEIARLKEDVASMPIYINALVSPDGKAAAVIADFKQDASTPNFISLNKDLHALLDRERDDTVDLYLGGLPMVGEAADREFLKMPMFFAAALVIIMLVQYLVVPQPPGNDPAAADRHPERDLEPRVDGPAERPPRSPEHDDAHPGPGGRVRTRDSNPETLLRGILAADRERLLAARRQSRRGGRIDRARRAGDDGGRTDRRPHVLLARRAPAFRWCSTSASSPVAACWRR